MKISFHGAARTVTGSKHLLTLKSGKKVLLDCGLFQGMGKNTEELNAKFGFEPAEISYLILSHAHIDHSGLIPKLVKEGFKGTIYATPATKALAEILIEDGKTNKITFSGDVGRYNDAILRSPDTFDQADYIILESTYGNKLHDEVFGITDTILKWMMHTCVEKKGKLIIPAFSVGRTQEILYAPNQLEVENRLPNIPVYVDSPLSREATELLKQFPENYNKRVKKIMEHDHDPFDFKTLKFIKTVDESKQLNDNDAPCVIISASGMADAGRVKHHIMNNIEKERTTILMVGYCDPYSLGGRLTAGQKEVKIFGELYQVKAEIGVMKSMSAHGDYEDLCQFLSGQNPELVRKLFLVHGEQDVQIDFAARLRRKHYKEVIIPEMHETHLLD